MDVSEDVMTIKEVADFLKVKPVTIYKLLSQKRIPAVKISGAWRFKRNLLNEWIERGCIYEIQLRSPGIIMV